MSSWLTMSIAQSGRLGADQRLARQMPTCSPLRVSIEPSSQHLTPVSRVRFFCRSSSGHSQRELHACRAGECVPGIARPEITYRRPRGTRRVGLFLGGTSRGPSIPSEPLRRFMEASQTETVRVRFGSQYGVRCYRNRKQCPKTNPFRQPRVTCKIPIC